jgi:putative FmdB family regulatory protein
MPMYEFQCTQCNTKMEVLQKFDDPDPVCGCGHTMKRQISSTNFCLKGTGWHRDGYSHPAPKKDVVDTSIRAGYNAVKPPREIE